jgi:hypothetical protein
MNDLARPTRPARSVYRRALAALSVLAVPALVLAPAAGASTHRPAAARGGAVFSDGGLAGAEAPTGTTATASRAGKHPNRAFAGYLTMVGGSATVQARLTVPRFACTSSERAISPGAFLLSGPTDHEYFNAANIILGCYKGSQVTEEALVINNREKDFDQRLHTGDIVIVRVSDDPTGAITVLVRDVTEEHRFTVRLSGRGPAAQAELVGDWASVDTSTQLPVAPPRFAPTTFSSGRVNHRPLGSLMPTGFDMAGAGGKLQIAAGPLVGAAHDQFTCTRL